MGLGGRGKADRHVLRLLLSECAYLGGSGKSNLRGRRPDKAQAPHWHHAFYSSKVADATGNTCLTMTKTHVKVGLELQHADQNARNEEPTPVREKTLEQYPMS